MLVVRFIRKDGKPNEEYSYQRLSDALYHIHLFKDDNSGLYDRIELGVINESFEFEEIAYTLKY